MLDLTINARSLAGPGAVDGLRRGLKLLHRVFGHRGVVVIDHLLIAIREPLDGLAVECLLGLDALGFDEVGAPPGKRRRIDAEDDSRIAFEKAPPAIPGKAGMAGLANEAVDRGSRATDVEHGIQHSRHRARGAGPHRYQQGIAPVAEAFAGGVFKKGNSLDKTAGELLAGVGFVFDDCGTKFNRQYEGGRHRQTERGHADQIGRFRTHDFRGVPLGRAIPDMDDVHVSLPLGYADKSSSTC